MVAAASKTKRWDARHYERIAAVRYEPGVLIVSFEDGTDARVDIGRLTMYGVRENQWAGAIAEDYHVTIQTDSESAEIPWDVIRYLSDREFAAYWDDVMAEAGRRIGRRFRNLREQHALSTAELASRTGISEELVWKVETGEAASDLELEERILVAMGCTFDDLSGDP